MGDAKTYTVTVQESRDDITELQRGKYRLQVATAAAKKGDQPNYNIVYQSGPGAVAPEMDVSWTTQYGLNWTANVPAPGAKIKYGGGPNWQPCAIGDSYNLNATGFWDKNQNDPDKDPNSLNVGSNDYSQAIHVVLGVQDSDTKNWNPIWVSETPLLVKGNGQYTPLKQVSVWFAEHDLSGTVVNRKQGTTRASQDLSLAPHYYFHFQAKKGTWEQQPTPFPPFPPSEIFADDVDELIPLISVKRGVTFENLCFSNVKIVE